MQRAVLLSSIAILLQLALFAGGARAHVGTGIAVDRHGRVYFADTLRNRIWRIAADGKLSLLVTGIHTDLLVVADDGNLYVQNDRPSAEAMGGLLRITPEGRVTPLPSPIETEKEMGRLLTVDRQGNIYFLRADLEGQREPRILKKTPQGQVSMVARSDGRQAEGKHVEAKFTHVNSSVWGPDGSLYLSDGNSIRKVAPDGSVSTLADAAGAGFVGNEELDLRWTLGLAVDGSGNVYVAHYWKRSVFKITPRGETRTMARSRWPWLPTGVGVAGLVPSPLEGSDVYFLERVGHPYGLSAILELSGVADLWGNPRVRKISPDGKVTTLASVRGGTRRATIAWAIFLFVLVFLFALVLIVRRIRGRKWQWERG